MKRLLFLCLLATTLQAEAQQEVELGEVTVKGAKTAERTEGKRIYPTRQQLESAANGYMLLSRLTLPQLRVDPVMHTITPLSNLGGVQVRINDIAASQEDLMALDVKAVRHIEYIDNPGVRYGEGTAYVINIVVKRATDGYVAGADLTNTLTTVNGTENLFTKYNRGNSELGISYTLDYQNFKGTELDERARYQMEDGDIVTIHRRQLEGQDKRLAHKAQLTYNLSDSTYVLQAKLSGRRDISPHRQYTRMDADGTVYDDHSSSRSASPAIDLYFHRRLGSSQSLTANAVGTYIKTDSYAEYNEGGRYDYTIDGRTASLYAEAIYENQLKPFNLSGGLRYYQKYIHNEYAGSTEAVNDIRSSDVYLFTQLKGQLGHLGYMAGLGASNYYYRQADHRYRFWLFRPKFTLTYPLAVGLRLKYDFEVSQHVSQIALVNDVSIKQNALETLVGNPDIRPNRVTSHDLRLTYSNPRLTAELQGYYRMNAHCNMEQYRREGRHFYKTQTNADNECSFFFIQGYNQWDIIPERLSATLYGGLFRFFNFTDDYRHTYTSFNGGISLEAYLGRWTLTAYADNGWHFMEGEHRGHQPAAWTLAASYQTKHLTLSLYAQHPFSAHPLSHQTEVLNRHIYKEVSMRSSDQGNMLTLTLSWHITSGRKYRPIHRTINHQDQDAGILQGR
ncbi:MAG: hypothetical protein IJ546_06770 [Prevotella sp.]|nr:hypothetical protein [Prevotella sp.]